MKIFSMTRSKRKYKKHNLYRRIQEIPSGGGGGAFIESSTYFKEGRMDLPREAIGPQGPIASRGGSVHVSVFLRTPITTCDFSCDWSGSAAPPPPGSARDFHVHKR